MTHGPVEYQRDAQAGKACIDDDTWVALVGGGLSPREQDEVDAHIDGCEACFDLYASLAGGATEPPGRPRIDRYELGDVLGAGAMGVVYDAFDTQLERHVAIKVLNPTLVSDEGSSATRRLLTEAKALAQLRHPHVVTVHDGGVTDERVYLVMERIDGASARERMQLAPGHDDAWLAWFRQAGLGLGAAHAQGIVHRDFKPANVLIGHDGVARVADFGLAKPTGAPDLVGGAPVAGTEQQTQTGAVVGTPAYLAPEVAAGGEATPQSDQYSFCVSLYEVLHRKRPSRPLSFRRGIPWRYRRALRRGLAPEPNDRFATMTELVRALAPPTRLRTLARGAAAAMVLFVVAVLGFALWTDIWGPPYVLVSGRELAPHHRERLGELGLVAPGDTIHLLYSSGVFDIEDDMAFLTDDHVVIHDPLTEPVTVRLPLATIDEVLLMDEVGYLDMRLITLILDNGDEYDIPAPPETPAAQRYADGIRRAIDRHRADDFE